MHVLRISKRNISGKLFLYITVLDEPTIFRSKMCLNISIVRKKLFRLILKISLEIQNVL